MKVSGSLGFGGFEGLMAECSVVVVEGDEDRRDL